MRGKSLFKKKMKAISLFSGAGGLDVGFEKAGIKVVWANDFDKNATNTYALNHSSIVRTGDIRNYLDEISTLKDIDVVFGGPPCQGFSIAGKMDPNDERSKLIFTFFDAVEKANPKIFVLENVKALAVMEKWSNVRKQMIKRAHALGFNHVELVVLNASEYGIPQKRERMFLIGIKDESNFQADAIESRIIQKKVQASPISEYLKKLGPAGSVGNEGVCAAKITIAKQPVLRGSAYSGMLFNGQGRPINPNGYANTLTASMGGSRTPIIDEAEVFEKKPSWIENFYNALRSGEEPSKFTTPSSLRRITTQEAAMIQTFPEDYKFSGPQSSVYRQIGNAVPCDLAFIVASSINEYVAKQKK